MTSQPDQFFREKLENFQRPAPAGAWDRVEKNLSRPSAKIIWLRAAAGIALLATAAMLVWPSGKSTEPVAARTEKNQPTVIPSDTIKTHLANQEHVTAVPAKETNTQLQKTNPIHISSPVANVEKSSQPSVTIPNDSIHVITSQPQELIAEVATPNVSQPSNTIVYTANEVQAKFLKKKLSPEATPENKDASGIQKLIGLAYAAKNSAGGIADLRQKKDDLFALNFGKKKGEN